MINFKSEVVKHGHGIIEDKNRFNSFMNEFYPKDNKTREIILAMIEEGLIIQIKTNSSLRSIKDDVCALLEAPEYLAISIINAVAIAYDRKKLLPELKNTYKYEGEIVDEKPHGQGIMSLKNDEYKYEGNWFNGTPIEKGVLFYKNEKFEIEWKDFDNKIEFSYLKEYNNKKIADIGVGFITNIVGDYFRRDEENKGTQDYEEMVKWYKISVELENSEAMHKLGYCYSYGEGVDEDINKALKLYKKSAELGNNWAIYELGNYYYSEDDYQKAVELYLKSAELGNSEAMNTLGDCYYDGNGVKKNRKEAKQWYEKSAKLGNEDAKYNLEEKFSSFLSKLFS